MDGETIAIGNTILRGEVGSGAHGTGLKGHEDIDHMGIFIEPPVNVCGLHPVDHYIYRDQPEGVRSQPGDLDLTMYSLRKFCRLAVKGNPSVLLLLWLPEYVEQSDLGRELVEMREAFIGREAGGRYLGYLVSQRKALTGERSKKVARPELVEKFGYDTKFAMHALRLGMQGIEYLTEQHLSVPVREPERATLLAVRRGEISFQEALKLIEDTEARLRSVVDACTIDADVGRVQEFMITAHQTHWAGG